MYKEARYSGMLIASAEEVETQGFLDLTGQPA